jgi:hypothetical protein
MSLFINTNNGPIYSGCNVTVINGQTAVSPAASPRPESATEDIEPVDTSFSLLTDQCRKEGKAQAVEAELRSAANASAAKLVAAIRTNEALGYLDTKNMSSRALYDALNDRFGLKYSVRNFTMARNK